jgi:hypothetical protein
MTPGSVLALLLTGFCSAGELRRVAGRHAPDARERPSPGDAVERSVVDFEAAAFAERQVVGAVRGEGVAHIKGCGRFVHGEIADGAVVLRQRVVDREQIAEAMRPGVVSGDGEARRS